MLEALLRELEEPGNGRVFGLSLDESDFIWRADPDAIIASRNRGFQVKTLASADTVSRIPLSPDRNKSVRAREAARRFIRVTLRFGRRAGLASEGGASMSGWNGRIPDARGRARDRQDSALFRRPRTGVKRWALIP